MDTTDSEFEKYKKKLRKLLFNYGESFHFLTKKEKKRLKNKRHRYYRKKCKQWIKRKITQQRGLL